MQLATTVFEVMCAVGLGLAVIGILAGGVLLGLGKAVRREALRTPGMVDEAMEKNLKAFASRDIPKREKAQ